MWPLPCLRRVVRVCGLLTQSCAWGSQLENTDMDLWMFYVRYVSDNVLKSVEERWDELKKRATSDASVSLPELRAAASAVMDARIVVGQAFELAVSKVGSAINAGVLWREFLAFLKRAPVR